ncbi:lactonase family protein [Polaribacter sp. MSW13]|uniref:Lactonase family protein n=1 Tax=Polaribacter marinus TaxID=2916838 RepID=A0A9X1VQY2_9FLAO|nr:lactonase family protein [Polaribacter marinus]MCI2227821.1 lactonase family protein [Polaribacter marinus]
MKSFKTIQIITLLLFIVIVSCKKESKNKVLINENKKDLEILVGTYTKEKSKGVYKLQMNSNTGEFQKEVLVAELSNPSYLTTSKNNEFVYVIQENDPGTIVSFKWNKDKTELVQLSTLPTNGKHPCYVSLNSDENLVAVGNYSSGNISVYNVSNKGVFNSSIQTKKHEGKGTILPNQENPHAHCTTFYNNKFLYAVDLGIDEILCYPIHNSILENKKTALKTDSGDGPRHLVFHSTKKIAYLINEFSNSIIVSKINEATGVFNRIQKISTLPKDFIGKSFSADIHLSKDGNFLYASNRGHNSIATFSVTNEGKLTLINHISTGGNWPRNFALSKDNKFLVVANQKSNNIVVFKRDKEKGTLKSTEHEIEISIPVFLKFL